MKSGLKAGILLQFSQELMKSENELTELINKGFIKEKRKLFLKDSIRVLEWDMKHGHDGGDFAVNMYSVVLTGKGYRIPRIVKRLIK